jgi:hypothetical protein
MAAPVVGDNAIAFAQEEEHLGIPSALKGQPWWNTIG